MLVFKSSRRRTRDRRNSRSIRRAFTLLEIIVVVTIIALLATLVAPKLLQNVWRSKRRVAFSNATSIAQQLQIYLVDHGMSKPPEDLELTVLAEGTDAQLRAADLVDPWNRPYILQVPGTDGSPFDIISYGGNGEPGGDGEDKDVNSSVKE